VLGKGHRLRYRRSLAGVFGAHHQLLTFKRRPAERGQSVVEFALVLPLLVFLMVAIIDLARIYTTMLSVESAAREAADYGSFGAQKWNPATFNIPPDGVVPKMEGRACTAASNLTDFAGSTVTCSNPGFSYSGVAGPRRDNGARWTLRGTAMTRRGHRTRAG
jgi:hypothetical protein